VLGATALLATACGGSGGSGNGGSGNTASGSKNPIKIGVSLSLTGDFSADGKAFQQGYQLWAKTINAKGGLLGRKVTLDIVNDASSPVQVVTNYQKLISVDHVDLVFGPFSTLLTKAASQAAGRRCSPRACTTCST
jgi:branched-chain amino acid transport system substrate-binding protein